MMPICGDTADEREHLLMPRPSTIDVIQKTMRMSIGRGRAVGQGGNVELGDGRGHDRDRLAESASAGSGVHHDGMSEIAIPGGSLVVLIGVSGAGKSTFASRQFRPTEVLSSDSFRAMVADDPADQRASAAAFELLHLAAHRRLERGRLTVVDATNTSRTARRRLVAIARATHRPAIALVLRPPLATALARTPPRPSVAVDVIVRQSAQLDRSDAGLHDEGLTLSIDSTIRTGRPGSSSSARQADDPAVFRAGPGIPLDRPTGPA
jgi:predicted kinase